MKPRWLIVAATVIMAGPLAAQAMSSADYPPEALRNHWEGQSQFKLTIGPDGSVQDCVITQSSGHAVLDDAACAMVKRRARFTPARDAAGNGITAHYTSAINWTIPK
jgi:protein TonB